MEHSARLDLLGLGSGPAWSLAWPSRVASARTTSCVSAPAFVDLSTDISDAGLRQVKAFQRRHAQIELRIFESPMLAAAVEADARLTAALDLAHSVRLQSRGALVRLASTGALGADVPLSLQVSRFDLEPVSSEAFSSAERTAGDAPRARVSHVLVCAAPGEGARPIRDVTSLATSETTFDRLIAHATAVVLDRSLRRVDPGFIASIAASGRTVYGHRSTLAALDRPLPPGVIEVDSDRSALEIVDLAIETPTPDAWTSQEHCASVRASGDAVG